MKINLSLFLKTIIATVAVSATLAYAQPSGDPTRYDVEAAMSILKAEIGRDKEWATLAMSRGLLRKVRIRLEKDLKSKEPVAKRLAEQSSPEINQAIKVFLKTTQDERNIANGKKVSDRLRHQARYTLRDNIPKKEEAIRQFQTWIKK